MHIPEVYRFFVICQKCRCVFEFLAELVVDLFEQKTLLFKKLKFGTVNTSLYPR